MNEQNPQNEQPEQNPMPAGHAEAGEATVTSVPAEAAEAPQPSRGSQPTLGVYELLRAEPDPADEEDPDSPIARVLCNIRPSVWDMQ